MDQDILRIQESVIFDESVSHLETHAHQPYSATNFTNNAEIRIAVQNQDLYVLPSRSSLHITGRIANKTTEADLARTDLINNGICFLFDEIRYELNGVEIDEIRNVGVTTSMKYLVSATPGQVNVNQNAGWYQDLGERGSVLLLQDAHGRFDVNIPMKNLLGFCEDYQKIIVNAKHELILVRSNVDTNAVIQPEPTEAALAEDFKITLTYIEWMLPYVRPADSQRVKLLGLINKNITIPMAYRTWELFEYPTLPQTDKVIWTVKTSTQLEKPRFVILGFKTSRKDNVTANALLFDHNFLRNVKLYLNSQSYPYRQINASYANHQFSLLYDMYTNFQSAYYGKENEPFMARYKFMNQAMLVVIDCSKQNENLKTGPVDVRLEIETTQNIIPNTSAYCLILHDRLVHYRPLSGDVTKQL